MPQMGYRYPAQAQTQRQKSWESLVIKCTRQGEGCAGGTQESQPPTRCRRRRFPPPNFPQNMPHDAMVQKNFISIANDDAVAQIPQYFLNLSPCPKQTGGKAPFDVFPFLG